MWFSCKTSFDSVPNRVKLMIKVMAFVALVLYLTLVLCQNVSGYQDLKLSDSFRRVANTVDVKHDFRIKTNIKPKDELKIRSAATSATPKPPTIELNDIFISVKTTKSNHNNRLDLILNTWHQLAKEQTWFFTDDDDKVYQDKTGGHLINTNCSNGHFRRALCCKMSVELDMFLESSKKWFCHFDDDNYVNVPRLVSLLNEYSPTMEWYLGKPSVASPLEIHLEYKKRKVSEPRVKFWFATGGAGFCISRSLALRMMPIAGGGKFISIGDRIRFPDDVTMGFVIEHLLSVPLTVVDQFHSHLEPMEYIGSDTFQNQVSFSYGKNQNDWNVINIDGFDKLSDPTRYRSLHCHLFPQQCKR
ncbi:fringe glycosyltransferase-like [Bradysia coprophila]|uniref:fringe glycosyltransferase-like n=1 Tax=Bradysia coprophila TaxID=38358 RepID=UPI00187DD09A|nr:fringe glycosyltransferase-like [Bradysia coprophila]